MGRKATLALTHYGRRSGRAYRVTVWYVLIDGFLWIGSLDATRSWVRNLLANGRAEVEFGGARHPCSFRRVSDARGLARFERAIIAKYPVRGRLLRLFVRGQHCVFCSARPLVDSAGDRVGD